jgi:hypothetical protein
MPFPILFELAADSQIHKSVTEMEIKHAYKGKLILQQHHMFQYCQLM